MRMKKQAQAGFTLMELMVVLVIVGLMMGLVTANMDSLTPTTRLNAAARNLASTINLAHNRAVMVGKTVIILYHIDSKYYQLILPAEAGGELAIEPLPSGVSFQEIEVVGENKKIKGWLKVYFSPSGMIRGHVVHLKNDLQAQISVEVNPISGVVDVIDGYHRMAFEEKP